MGKNSSLIISFIIVVFSCSTNYNRPFINTEETTKLSFGMSQNDVIRILGYPLFVESGGDSRVTYVYEVRTILVKSNLTSGEPNKFQKDQKHDSPNHELKLLFENGQLKSWDTYHHGENKWCLIKLTL